MESSHQLYEIPAAIAGDTVDDSYQQQTSSDEVSPIESGLQRIANLETAVKGKFVKQRCRNLRDAES